MKKTINSILTVLLVAVLFPACKDNQAENDSQNGKNYIIDTTVTINGLETKITVEKREDNSNKIIVSDELDAGDSKVVSNADSKFTHYSMEYLISFEDKNGKSKSSINLDLLSELNKSSKLESEIGNLKGQIISDGILFDGIAQNELLMFKVSTWDGGEGGGEWTIGVVKDKNTTIENAPCVLMAYDRVVGEDFHYKNNKFFIGQFLGSWSSDCTGMGWINFNEKNDFAEVVVASNQIFLNANFSLDKTNPNKLLLFLRYNVDANFGDFGAGGANLPWNDYSKDKAIAELLYNPSAMDELEVKWLGFYNTKTNSYEWSSNPEFMTEGNKTIKKCSK
jgi:hypothetical protein